MPQSRHGPNGNDDVEIGKARTAKKACRSKTMIGLKVILVLATIGMVAFNTFKCRSLEERSISRLEMNDVGHLLYSVNKKIDSMNDKISRLENAVESNEKSLKSKKSDDFQTIQAIYERINQIVDQRNEDIKAINKRNEQQVYEINKIVEHMNNNLIFG